MNPEQKKAFVEECQRQQEACLYTSTTLYIWLRSVRFWRSTFIAAPIVLGGIGSWAVLKGIHSPTVTWITAACSLLAGMFPAIFKALELDGHVASLSHQAAGFKTLQDRFRQTANFIGVTSEDDAVAVFGGLMKELGEARSESVTPPERFFKQAQKKVAAGDYSFAVDSQRN
jgi:hypothetical protein